MTSLNPKDEKLAKTITLEKQKNDGTPRVSVDLENDRDPTIAKLKAMTFGQYLKTHLCPSVTLASATFGMSLLLEYYLYRHRVDDHIYIRNRKRREILRFLKRHNYKAHFENDGRLVIEGLSHE